MAQAMHLRQADQPKRYNWESMSKEDPARELGALILQKKEVDRRLACRIRLAERASVTLNSLAQPWALDWNYIREHMGSEKDKTVGEFVNQIESDVKESGRLKEQIDAITNA